MLTAIHQAEEFVSEVLTKNKPMKALNEQLAKTEEEMKIAFGSQGDGIYWKRVLNDNPESVSKYKNDQGLNLVVEEAIDEEDEYDPEEEDSSSSQSQSGGSSSPENQDQQQNSRP